MPRISDILSDPLHVGAMMGSVVTGSVLLQGHSVCGATQSSRTAVTRWWSSLSEPSCTPKTESSCTSCAPEFPVSNGRRRRSECVSQCLLCDSPLSVGVQVCRRPRSSSCTRSPGSAASSLCSISVASASVSWSESTTSRSCRCQRESWRTLKSSLKSSLLTLKNTASVLDFQLLP